VGLKAPNAFGLHDMLGNVEEVCAGWYDYPRWPKETGQVAVDPPPTATGSRRLVKGACVVRYPEQTRAQWRISCTSVKDRVTGFRVARDP